MKKNFILTMLAMIACYASYAIYPIMGSTGSCMGTNGHVYDSTAGGTWSINPTTVATIDASGYVYPVSTGVAVITYTVGSATVTSSYTVSATPAAISGPSSVCPGASISLTDAVTGGTWSSLYPSSATVNAATGVVYGVTSSSGTYIRYTTGPGCYVQTYVTVTNASAAPISGLSSVCLGSVITLHDSTSGGTWSSSNSGIASVGSSTGAYVAVTGVSAGVATISYAVSTTCGMYYAVYNVTVTTTTAPPSAIGGPTSVTAGSTINLTDATTGGTWSVTPSTVATINPTTGLLGGVGAGTATVTYTIPGCGSPYVTYTVTVNPFDGISGTIHFTGAAHYGPVKVWLITYAAPNLAAIDSAVVYATGTSANYQFLGEPTDSFRVKAATIDSVFTGTGYMPTYHTSSFYWNGANVFYHVSGTSNTGVDINMAYGTVTSGPGFVAGDVTTGANKGTTTSSPVSNLMMYIFDATTAMIQAVRTDAAGHYSFSNLPTGTYYVFPDSLNYLTTPYASINITTAAPSFSSASFIQHTLSHTITPIAEGVNNISAATASLMAFPNPTNGRVNIAWQSPVTEEAAIIVTDVTGRIVYNGTVNITAGAGSTQLNLSTLTSGLYTLSIKGDALSYNTKVQVQH